MNTTNIHELPERLHTNRYNIVVDEKNLGDWWGYEIVGKMVCNTIMNLERQQDINYAVSSFCQTYGDLKFHVRKL